MKKKNKNKKILKITRILVNLLFIILCYLFALSIYIKRDFSSATFEQLYFTLTESQGFSFESIKNGVIFVSIVGTILLCLFFIIPYLLNKKTHYLYNLKIFFKKHKIININIPFKLEWKYYVLFYLIFIIGFVNNIGLLDYMKNQVEKSTLYEDYYVSPNDIQLEFPKKKQNLIYIYLESMESSFSKMNIKGEEQSIIKELEHYAEEGINFSNTEELGGALSLNNTTWTVAGMVAQTSGIPLTIVVDSNNYTGYDSFLPGVTSLGDILYENGYNNYLLIGSGASFGGRKDYFEQHGNYQIYDYTTAKKNGDIDDNYYVWWGYEDKKLYEIAKRELLEIAQKNKPFNFTMLTVDTHFQDGYLDEKCQKKYDDQYSNVISCSSAMVYKFVEWIKTQQFYENTTIVLAGDHLTMQSGEFIENIESSPRTVYNVFLNGKAETNNSKNRLFSTLDFYPTTLASLGVKIEGDRLGLGTNLFSQKKTLIEELGYEYFNSQIILKSDYYNNVFLKNTYYDMLKTKVD